jgi:CHASE3 domain sensor protein
MTFEEAGRALDREFEKLRKFLKDEVRPETKKEAAEFLRKSAARLTKMAERLEKEKAKS